VEEISVLDDKPILSRSLTEQVMLTNNFPRRVNRSQSLPAKSLPASHCQQVIAVGMGSRTGKY
jgi:hypothetical protein